VAIVQSDKLTKQYGTFTALHDCTLAIPSGQVFGLLGPNGAGKTTLLRLLLGFLRPTSGTARIDGLDCYRDSVAVHRRVAYLPGDVRLFSNLRGAEVLKFFCEVRPGTSWPEAQRLCERLSLDLKRNVWGMSTGMRQKLALASVFAVKTPLLILDEPTSNLDPTVRGTVAALVREAQQAGRTVVFSSHVLSEVEQTCDRVCLLKGGQIVFDQPLAAVRRGHRIFATLAGPLPAVPLQLAEQLTVVQQRGAEILWETPGELSALLGWLATLPLAEVRIEPVGLQAVYDKFHPPEELPAEEERTRS